MSMRSRKFDSEVKRAGQFAQCYIVTNNKNSVWYDGYISVVVGNYRRAEVLHQFQKKLLGNWEYHLEILTRRPSVHPEDPNVFMTEFATWHLGGILGWRDAGCPQIFWCGRTSITFRRDSPDESVLLNENLAIGAKDFYDLIYKMEMIHARTALRNEPLLRKKIKPEESNNT